MLRNNKFLLLAILAAGLLSLRPAQAFNLSGQRWPNGQVTMHLQLGPASPLADGATSWGDVAESALNAWNSNLTNVRFVVVRDSTARIVQGRDSTGAVTNNVFWSPTVYGDAWGPDVLGITLSTYDPRTSRYSETDVLFNLGVEWNSYRGPLRKTSAGAALWDFRRVAMHEFGHVLGLNHPDAIGQQVSAIMNTRASDVDALSADDIAGGKAIYDNPSIPPSSLVSLKGDAGWSSVGNQLKLEVDRIPNEGDAASHTLRLELWAMLDHIETGLPPGSRNMGLATLPDTIAPGAALTDVEANAPLVLPPNGSYYVALVLTEFTGGSSNNGYTVRDWIEFDQPFNVGPRTAPVILTQPDNVAVLSGSPATFSVVTVGGLPRQYQWRKDGAPVEGATKATLTLANVQPANGGTYTVLVTNDLGTVTSSPAKLIVGSNTNPGRLINMSIRTNAGTDDNTLIVGVGLGGANTSGKKAVLLRAVGPTLGAFGVGGALTDTTMAVFQGSTQVLQNDNWGGAADLKAAFTSVGAFGFSADTSLDAAVYNPEMASGSYSIQISGKNNATGVALAEIYDATPAANFNASTPRLVNVSARTQVGTGDNILIAGFVVGGSTNVRVLVRAIGPTLGAFGVGGVLANPKLEIFNASASQVAVNDDWSGSADLKAAFTSVGAFPLSADNSRDAAVIAILAPGNYSVQVSGVGNTTGVALVELYELP